MLAGVARTSRAMTNGVAGDGGTVNDNAERHPKDRPMTTGPLFSDTMATMTARQIAQAADRGAGVLLPIGVMEAHGPHLPTGTDALLATQLCHLTRRYAAQSGREFIVAPPYYWGINGILGQFAGSFNIRPETAAMLLTDVIDSLIANRFTDILLVSHHGDMAHNQMLLTVVRAQQAQGRPGVRWLYAPARWKMIERLGLTLDDPVWVRWTPTPALDRFKTTGILGVHADEHETAGIVRYFPETVDYDALRDLPPTRLTPADLAEWRTGDAAARKLTPDGYFGAPNPVDPDLWRHFDEQARIMAAALCHGETNVE
jgi:creatinine amidohydrolase